MNSLTSLRILNGLFLLSLAMSVYAGEAEERYRQAGHPATTAAVLAALSFDKDVAIRKRIACNRKTPGEVLLRLAKDPALSVKICIATNLSAPEGVYRLLVRDANQAVRSVVARFEYVPVSALEILAKDKNVDVRLEVARNLNSTKAILTQLQADPDGRVKAVAELALQRLK